MRPIGSVETTRLKGPGIATAHTEEHEGFRLSPERNAAIDPRWREESGWYEADVKGEIVIVSNPDLFSPGEVEEAHCILRSYHPDEHEAVVGARPERFGLTRYSPIKPGESFIRDWNTLWQDKRETHLQAHNVEYSAEHPDHVVVTLAEPRESYWDTEVRGAHKVLVPREEYQAAAEAQVIAVALPRDNSYRQIA